MLLSCEACHAPLEAGDVDLRRGIATCRYCKAVMRFDALAATAAASVAAESDITKRPEIGLPAGISVEDWGGDLRIVRRWFTPGAFILVFFCITWDSFLIFWYTTAIGVGAPWIFKVFPVAHVAVGVGLTYLTIACFVNRTIITVQGGQLGIRHGPLPWIGNQTLDTTQISQIYTRQHVRNSQNGTQQSTYRLHAVTTDGRNLKLLSGLMDEEQALYIEQRLEQQLGIDDRPIDGELPR
jgi:hypothetical protein